MYNDLQVNQPAIIINVEHQMNVGLIGRSVMVVALLSVDESNIYFRNTEGEPYAYVFVDGRNLGILQRYLMPIPPLDDQTEIESKLILRPETEKA